MRINLPAHYFGGTAERSHNLVELLHYFALLVHEQSGVTHYVNKKDVRSFQVTRFFSCSSHRRDQLTHEPQAPLHHSFGAREATIFSKRGSPRSEFVELFRCELPAELLICLTISKVFR